MQTDNFETREGEQNSIEILRKGHGAISPLKMIGFVAMSGQFFFDTEREQVRVNAADLLELIQVVNWAISQQISKIPS